MKILAIMGSPRKGDSYQITKVFEEKLNALEKVEFKYLFLKEVNLEYCRGCCVCMAKGEDFCPAKDTTLKIREEMLNSDGVVFVSPVYAHQVTALMKNFVDHFSYVFHRPCFFDKVAMVISTTGGSGLKEVLSYLEMTARGWGFYVIHKLGVIAPAFQYAPEYRNKLMNEIDEVARKFFEAIKTKRRPSPDIYDLIFFRAIRLKIKHTQKYFPCDYRYWKEKGWIDKDYYTDTQINIFKKLYAWFVEKQIEKGIRKKFKLGSLKR